jgi:hypothetical protein
MGFKAGPGAGGLLDLLNEGTALLPGSDKDEPSVLQRTLSHILDLSPGEQLNIKCSSHVRHLLEERYAAVSPQLEPGEVPAGRVGPARVLVEPSSSFSMSTADLWYVKSTFRCSNCDCCPCLTQEGRRYRQACLSEESKGT